MCSSRHLQFTSTIVLTQVCDWTMHALLIDTQEQGNSEQEREAKRRAADAELLEHFFEKADTKAQAVDK
jgi:hypothetical protein